MAKKRDSVKTKEKIILSAMEVFAKDGYDGVSVDLIAHKADINKAMIYYYFTNKSKLYEVVIEKVLLDIYDTIILESKKFQTPTQRLNSFIFTFAFFVKKNPYLSSLMLVELSNGGKNLPKNVFVGFKKIFSLLNSILKDGEERGCFVKTMPIVIHFMIVGTINLFITTASLREDVLDEFGADIGGNQTIDDVAKYISENIIKMLKEEKRC